MAAFHRRAVPHIHALIRLDPATTAGGDSEGHGPAATSGGGEHRHVTENLWESPITAAELAVLIQQSRRRVTFTVTVGSNGDATEDAQHFARCSAEGVTRRIEFGTQLVTPKTTGNHKDSETDTAGGVAGRRVAGYLAKYVTKSLAGFGIAIGRISPAAIGELDVSEHVRAILSTIAALADEGLSGIRRWLHTLGYRGHVTTKSRRYSTNMGALRAVRMRWVRESKNSAEHHDSPSSTDTGSTDEPVLWEFDRAGHVSLGDRVLVVSAALRHIEARRVGLIESRYLPVPEAVPA